MRHHYRPREEDPLYSEDILRPLPDRLERIFLEVGDQIGYAAEDKFEFAFQIATHQGKIPSWITSWRRTERCSKEDKAGIDFIFSTDVGDLNINVKSSRMGTNKFLARHRGQDTIRPFIVDLRKPNMMIFREGLDLLELWREEKKYKK